MWKSPRNFISVTLLKVTAPATVVLQYTSLRKVNKLSSVPARINSYFSYLNYTFILYKERRSKKRAELNSPLPPLLSKPKIQKRKTIIAQSKEQEEKEQEERPLKRQPKDIARPQPTSIPSSAGTMDQPLSFEQSEPVAANLAIQPSLMTATISTNPSIDTTSSKNSLSLGRGVLQQRLTQILKRQESRLSGILQLILLLQL